MFIGLICLGIIILSVIAIHILDDNDQFGFIFGTLIIIIIASIFVGALCTIGNLINISETSNFIAAKSLYLSGVEEEALDLPILEYNRRLIKGQASREVYGWLSLYPKKVLELTIIQ